ncbi:TonB-dependent receptor domain-containing protein [Avibacterium paragallinarum]|uniref:Probable TonB-dependent receptor HI_1217 n=1 Tax=Avibacterium paragallinarum TaxID=728 RepID=A0A0F5EXH5_AVIPA|nr:TonB-dependent receptor [Avibacterium paragallinarum]KAA6208354.1 TonB-dependent receptor [Avibacterium paragallinarum]KKB01334.1 TonB-dependent receptor [Avibacterium paragallinarum]RZN73479.1 TonB-dependent receptor [Avibacterium paragallinarum]SUU98853.1 Probable TonB-dependent receptor HI_1217 precursor [Avibacterium paragallinarum]
MKFQQCYLSLALSACLTNVANAAELDTIFVKSNAEVQAEQKKDEVYLHNITNMYSDKEAVERYKGAAPADLFQAFNGVYSGDARNSGAVDPNIRGVQGQGRIPVTIDGTEQAITTWRGYNGANNRNYLDPNLIGGITLEKGPALVAGTASGIGGTVKMRTIDVDDIVAPNQKISVELKLETSNNSVKEHPNNLHLGEDSRMYDPFPGDFLPTTLVKPKTKGEWGKDNAMRLAVGLREEKFDLLVAYSYRRKGNYLSGRGGSHRYEGSVDEKSGRELKQMEPNLPFAASIYRPHTEIPNTSSVMESYLLKNTWRFTDKQELKLGYRHTKMTYGEIMPSRLDFSKFYDRVPQWPLATVTQHTFNADYHYNPDNPLINLKAGIWYTRTISDTNTSVGNPQEPNELDNEFMGIAMQKCYRPMSEEDLANSTPDEFMNQFDLNCMKAEQAEWSKTHPNINGKYNFVNAAQSNAYNTRRGFNLSNQMHLTDKLDLTLSGSFQKEHLTSDHLKSKPNPNSTYESPARMGRRQEWDIAFNFNYRPTNWLMLTAGARYNEYWSYDDYLDKLVKSGVLYKPYEDNPDSPGKISIGKTLSFDEIVSQDIWNQYQQLMTEKDNLREEYRNRLGNRYRRAPEFKRKDREIVDKLDDLLGEGGSWTSLKDDGVIRKHSVEIDFHSDGRLHKEDNPFYNGTLKNEKVINPATGKVTNKYTNSSLGEHYEALKESDKLKKVEKRRAHAFAPAFSATAFLTDNSRVYLRYTQYARMPSIFEDTVGFSASADTNTRFKDARLKPERTKNIEVGYAYDFSSLFNTPTKADVKLSYYHNVTKNVIDRNTDFRFVQLDKRVIDGIELQARYDNGDYFADLGVAYNLKNKVCDADMAVEMDPVAMRVPHCMTGGFPWGYLRTQLQPKYSITANLGGRFFDRKLEIGSRWLYHSKAVNKQEARLFELNESLSTNEKIDLGWNRPMYWQPVLVVDAYIKYQFSPNLTVEFTGTNLTNRYYLDPMTRSMIPAPGRTFKLGLTAKF